MVTGIGGGVLWREWRGAIRLESQGRPILILQPGGVAKMTISKRMRYGFSVFFLVALGACGSQPAVPSGSDPSFTGYTYGSGNSRENDTTTMATSSADGDSTERGGYTYGSGN